MSKVLRMPSYLYNHQKDLIQEVLGDTEGKWYIVKSFRQQAGKTFCLQNLILAIALTRPGSVSIFVEPSNNQAAKVGSETYQAVSHLGVRFNGSSNIMLFPNGSKVYFKSSEADTRTIRGYTVKGGGILVVDEAAFVGEEYFNALFPIVQKYKAPVVLASTPDKQSGVYYDLYEKGLQNEQSNLVSLNWSQYLKDFYSEEDLEFYKSIYSSRRFRTEILGEFTVSSGTVFPNLERCLGKGVREGQLFVGIDWGSGSGKDYTVVTVLNDKKEMVFLKYFNDISPMEQVDYVAKLLQDFKPRRCLVESNSIGSIYYDALKQKCGGIQIEKFNTNNDSKCRIVDQLVAHLEQENIKLWDDEELLRQLKGFQEQVTKSGLRTYSCPLPLHDDCVMSLCIALEAACKRSGTYSIA